MLRKDCLIFDYHSSRATPGISFFRVPTKDDDYSTNWRNNTVAVFPGDRLIYDNLKRKI